MPSMVFIGHFSMWAFRVSTTSFNTYLADEHVVLPGGVVVDGLRRLQQEPDDVDDHLDEDEARAEEQLRLRRDEARPLRRPLRRVEDAGYPATRREGERMSALCFSCCLADMQTLKTSVVM